MNPSDWLIVKRKVRFGDCDSAGVIHFHNLLRWSHESWEESMDIYGIPCQDIFPDLSSIKTNIIFPIINCEANFFSPIKIGDFLKIKILPKKILHLIQTFLGISKIRDKNFDLILNNNPLGMMVVYLFLSKFGGTSFFRNG